MPEQLKALQRRQALRTCAEMLVYGVFVFNVLGFLTYLGLLALDYLLPTDELHLAFLVAAWLLCMIRIWRWATIEEI